MTDLMTDDDIDGLFEEHKQLIRSAAGMPPPAPEMPSESALATIPIYPLPSIGQAPAATPDPGLLKKQLGPLPVWAWGLIASGVGAAGYFFVKTRKMKENDGEDSDDSESSSSSSSDWGTAASTGKWHPTRTAVGEKLTKMLTKKGTIGKCTMYLDADEAKAKKLPYISPLITLKFEGGYKADKDLERLCKTEGLAVRAHQDGTCGLYPGGGKRGKEWEQYIDALRDEGQTV